MNVLGRRIFWTRVSPDVVREISLRTRERTFLSRPGDIAYFAIGESRMSWIEAFPTEARWLCEHERWELWTAAGDTDPSMAELVGSLGRFPAEAVHGDGLVAFRSPDSEARELTVVRLADGARLELRLAGEPVLFPVYVAAS